MCISLRELLIEMRKINWLIKIFISKTFFQIFHFYHFLYLIRYMSGNGNELLNDIAKERKRERGEKRFN